MKTHNQIQRTLEIFLRGMKGQGFTVSELAAQFQVSEKTIKRDINEIRIYFANLREHFGNMDVSYNRSERMYYFTEKLLDEDDWLMFTSSYRLKLHCRNHENKTYEVEGFPGCLTVQEGMLQFYIKTGKSGIYCPIDEILSIEFIKLEKQLYL